MQTDYFPDYPPDTPHPAFVTVLNPLGCTGKNDSTELRPYIDPTISGVNEAMAPLPLHLPSIEQILPFLQPGYFLAKRDWRHGFHHLTLHPSSRCFMGLRLLNGLIARFKALPFGASQSPAIFTQLANEFARLCYALFQSLGLTEVILVIYMDDLLLIAPTHAALL
jgi:hypothetical protein